MKKFGGCLVGAFTTAMLCIVTYYVTTYAVAAAVAEQLPEPVRSVAWDWISGTAQAVGHPQESDLPPGDAGDVIERGAYYWKPVFYSGPESFVCRIPVGGGYLTSGYGDTEGRTRPHTGVDYGTHGRAVGVEAPMGGKVTHAGWSYWLGWTVVVENNGWQTILGHMCCGEAGTASSPTGDSSLQVQPGDVIQAGTVVGETGTTGNSTGVHLHLEVRKCDGKGRCAIMDPSSVLLSGQSLYCGWEEKVRQR
jgi:murein DD-endopeptidase MepM/ murein hydrolase activator NlpD